MATENKPVSAASSPYPLEPSDRRLTILAWITTALVSTLPEILLIELFHADTGWLKTARMILLLVMALAAILWKPLRPLRNFFIAMLAFFGLAEMRVRLDFTIPWLQGLFGGTAFDVRMQAEQTGKLAVSLAMILLLLGLGLTRRRIFLTPGNLRAPIQPVRLLGFPKAEPWPNFGLQWGLYISAAIAILLYFGQRPDSRALAGALSMLPSILFYAMLNAFNEEMTIRAPMLSTLEPAAGSRQALWMAAYFFGIAHYFGTPGGLVGGIASIFMGWILSKAMLEIRGLFWAWWIHFLSDVVIFFFLAASLA